jgi:membrane protein implicated in regulation of membrane protease activity
LKHYIKKFSLIALAIILLQVVFIIVGVIVPKMLSAPSDTLVFLAVPVGLFLSAILSVVILKLVKNVYQLNKEIVNEKL